MKHDTATLAGRMFLAYLEIQRREGRRVSYAAVGARVAKRMQRRKPFTASSAQRWFHHPSSAECEVIAAVSAEAGFDPGWTAFGAASQAPAPRGFTAPIPLEGTTASVSEELPIQPTPARKRRRRNSG